MKFVIILFVSLFMFKPILAQQPLFFGEGIVTVKQYHILRGSPSMDTTGKLFMTYIYYIKGNKILRQGTASNSHLETHRKKVKNGNVTITSALSVSVVQPSYLIDMVQQKIWIFFKQYGRRLISEENLKEQTAEPFYNGFIPDYNRIPYKIHTDEIAVQIMAGNLLYKGQAIRNWDTVNFTYSKIPSNIRSPLNGRFPEFPYNILSLIGKATDPDGKSFSGHIQFVVSGILECKLDDTLFILPKNVEIRNRVPATEMYDPAKQ